MGFAVVSPATLIACRIACRAACFLEMSPRRLCVRIPHHIKICSVASFHSSQFTHIRHIRIIHFLLQQTGTWL